MAEFCQWSWGDTLTFQLPVPTSLLGITATIRALKPRSRSQATWVTADGVTVSDAADTVTFTFRLTAGVYDLDEYGRWLCEIDLSDGRTILKDSAGVPLFFDVIKSVRSL